MIVRDLTDALKRVPALAPDDSAARAIRAMRARGTPAVLVGADGRLVGVVYETDLAAIAAAPEAREALRRTLLAEVMRPVPFIAPEEAELAAVVEALQSLPMPAVPVAAADGRYLGLLLPRDLLAAIAGEPVVPPIAGLATPLGVYLTTGALRAGANDLALATTGAALMVLNLLSGALVGVVARLADRLPVASLLMGWGAPPDIVALSGVIAASGLQVAAFLALLRLSPLTGVHAAEHMVVRALEEGEDLALEKVRRMPRVHPRCGTNLMALVVLIVIAYQLLSAVRRVDPEVHALALVVLVMVVALSWRRLGAGLQRWITTRRPSDRQLRRAIGVGEELLARLEARPSAVAGPPRRVWQSGFLQVLIGFAAVALAVESAPWLAAWVWRP